LKNKVKQLWENRDSAYSKRSLIPIFWTPRLMRPWLITFAILALTPAFAQPAVSLPAWLESYPGAQPAVHSTDSLVESSYTVAAQPEQIIAHYRQLFEGAGLPYQPNPDGLGTSIRAATPECDLLIQIRTREEGVHVAVNCAAKSAPSAPISPGDVKMITGHPQAQPVRAQVAPGPPAHPMTADEMMEQASPDRCRNGAPSPAS
jgi:hypothetical protein